MTALNFENNNTGSTKLLYDDTTTSDFVVTLPHKTCTLVGIDEVIGIGQTWQDVTASRALGTTYTNSTGKPIFVSIGIGTNNVGWGGIQVNLNGLGAVNKGSYFNNAGFLGGGVSFIVPNGNTYAVTASASGGVTSISRWEEIR